MEKEFRIRHLSTGLYFIVNEGIGSAEIVRIRRMVADFRSSLYDEEFRPSRNVILKSGSRAEGFRFESSDIDIMCVYNDIRVGIEDTNSNPLHDREHFRIETDQTRPGFCYLRFVWDFRFTDNDIKQLLVSFQNGFYLSSLFWKEANSSFFQDKMLHGPCESGIYGHYESDIAHCLKFPRWPRMAYPCLIKLARLEWPSFHTLSKMFLGGCHIVPIGDKSSDTEIIEWRLSFSEAEKALIHEMNHCQFLTYGLLKIFLKEVINTQKDVDGLLCSYFLKTVVFWEIVNNGINWMKHEFLKWFWICFRRLLSWVSHGYCPNFFIPENNMFLRKIYGRSQQVLLRHLTSLYRMGYKCLSCCSININHATLINHLSDDALSYYERLYTKEKIDLSLINEIFNNFNCNGTIPDIYRSIQYLLRLLIETETFTSFVVICNFLKNCMQNFLYRVAQQSLFSQSFKSNKIAYKLVIQFTKSLKMTKYDASSHNILSAILLYKVGMYQHVVSKAKKTLKKIKGPNGIHHRSLNISKYRQFGGDFTPVDVMIKTFLICDIYLDIDTCLPELFLENQCNRIHDFLLYSPEVLLLFILYLSYNHLSMRGEAKSTLHELTILVHHGHLDRDLRNISWEILGISQEMAGYFDDAYLSYHNALKEPYFRVFRKATLLRIQNLSKKMRNCSSDF